MHLLLLEDSDHALRIAVLPSFADGGHADAQVGLVQIVDIVPVSILCTLVGMMNLRDRRVQCVGSSSASSSESQPQREQLLELNKRF